MFEDIKEIWCDPKPELLEETFPVKEGKPDFSCYTAPLQHYIDLDNSFLNTRLTLQGSTQKERNLAWKKRIYGTQGLQAKGQEALPYLLTLMLHPNPDAREDAAYLLGELSVSADVSNKLLAMLNSEQDLVVKSSIIETLGKLRYRPAIPTLAALITGPKVDVDTKWKAADSLGRIVRQNFSGPDKSQRAEAWLVANQI